MRLLQKIAAVVLILSMLAGCGAGTSADSSISADGGPSGNSAEIDTGELMDRYIIPYEYYSLGQNWNYDDPDYAWPYDPNDIFSRQVFIDYPVEGFALGVIVRELPEPGRDKYVYEKNDMGVGYNVTGALWDAVSRFYFGAPAQDPRDNLHAEDSYEGGLPKAGMENEGLAISFDKAEELENGDIRVIIGRELNGRPILSCAYTMRPFTVEDVPDELAGVFKPGDRACRFVLVEDIPFEAEAGIVEIKTPEDLRELSRVAGSGDPAYLKTTYLLMNDIDMAGESLEPIGGFTTRSIHDSNSDGFNAVFDGQEHAIRNLKMHVAAEDTEQACNTGMFAMIGRYGQVNNLRLEDCDISFDLGGLDCGNATGGLAGTNYGAVNNCAVTGKIAGSYQVGGLIGISGWGSVVSGCSVNASVTGEAEIGVFIGSLHNALIVDCISEGEVTAVNLPGLYDRPRAIGGFSGFMVMGSVRHCQSSAFVKTQDSADWVGGFMGYNQGEITDCFYDAGRTAGWEAVDVEYQGATSDVKDISYAPAGPAETAVRASIDPYPDGAPPSKAPDPALRRITFNIVDEKGNPVANVSGGLTQTSANVDSYRFLYGGGQDSAASDASGSLYLELEAGWEQREQSRSYTLMLYGHFDSSLQQEYQVELSDPPASYTITWALPHPPKERPPQTTGLRLFIVDTKGNPVQGVELGGSPYPKETTGPIPDIGMILGPSDENGYIRWDDVKPGTYELYGSRNDKSQKYEVKMPTGKAMADITLTWNP